MSAITTERTASGVDLTLTDPAATAGLTAVVAIRDGDDPTSYLDFSDDTFKTSGWTTKQAAMTDLGGGHYNVALDLSAMTNLPATTDQLVAEYATSGAVTSAAHDTIQITESFLDVPADVDLLLTDTHGGGSWQSAIATGGALNAVPNSDSTITIGAAVGGSTYENAKILDGVYWQIEDVGGALDMYNEFLIAADGVPVSVSLSGHLNSGNDDLDVYAYNWSGSVWEQIGTLEGKAGGQDDLATYTLFAQHVGLGSDLGKVRVRFFAASGLTSADLRIDQIVLSYAVINRSVGYADGAIWVDTIDGAAGAVPFINGTADSRVSNWADALLLSAALSIKRFHIIGGSTITLTGNSDAYFLTGSEWTLNLNGQSIAMATIVGAHVSGTSAGLNARFLDCLIGAVSLTPCGMGRCALTSSMALLSAGTYLLEGCFSGVAGSGTPTVDFGSSTLSTALNMRHYSGGIEIQNMGQAGTDTMSLEGDGQLVLAASCIGGAISCRGNFPVTDNAGGAVTLSDDARFTKSDTTDPILARVDGELVDIAEFLGTVIGSPVTHTPTTITVGGQTYVVALVGSTVTVTRTA